MRIALVTGGAGGLGLASARQFARDGMRVVIADLDAAAAQAAALSLPTAGHSGIAMDVSDEQSVIAGFAAVENGVGPIGVLAHFAGTLGNDGAAAPTYLGDVTVASWNRIFDINALGTFLCVREMVRWRRKLPVEHGRIITVSSIAGQTGGYLSGVGYAASKAAVLGITKNAARQLAPEGITVNAIAPGAIDTQMYRDAAVLASARTGQTVEAATASSVAGIPVGRIGQPDEIAVVASFLASPLAAFVTGQTIAVNGGSYV